MSLYLQGLAIGLAYVAPIGMQNLFVINAALTQSRRRLAGIGALVERFSLLRTVVLAAGGLVVSWIGVGLIRERPAMDRSVDMDIPLSRIAAKAFVVTWLNPQALIDGTLLFGSFRVGHPGADSTLLVLGSATASCLWFSGVTLVISLFSARFNDRVLRLINIVCGSVILVYGLRLILQFVRTI